MSDTLNETRQRKFDQFIKDCTTRGVFLIFERKYIYPGDEIPEKIKPGYLPHYRLLNRSERRNRGYRKSQKS